MNAETKIELPPDVQLIAALADALPELGTVAKTKDNPHFKSKYADLAAVIGALQPLAKHGLWFQQIPVDCDGGVAFETFYIHNSGARMSAGVTTIPVDRSNAQGYGSAQTYCRRYALQAAFGLAADDDDGNAAADAAPAEAPKPKRENWGGRYPNKTSLKQAMHRHHAEIERIGLHGVMDDLDAYLTSPEYQDYITQASEHAPAYLDGKLPDSAPPEFIQTFTLEQKARDMIALRGNNAMEEV